VFKLISESPWVKETPLIKENRKGQFVVFQTVFSSECLEA